MADDRMLRLPEVLALIGVAQTTLYKMIRDGKFPKQVRITTRIVGWRQSEVQAWIAKACGVSEDRTET